MLLDRGCKEEEAFVEAAFVELVLCGKEVAQGREGSGWKTLSRPVKEMLLRFLEMGGKDLDYILEMLP